jgi:hypothetical protein
MFTRNQLAAFVLATKAAHKYANELHPLLYEAVKPFVGSKVLTADGSLTAKLKKALPEMPHSVALRVSRLSHNSGFPHELAFVVKTCQLIPESEGCLYDEECVYVGNLSNGVLTDMCHPVTDRKCDYRLEEIEAQQAEVKRLKKLYEEAKSNLYPFPER